VFSRDKRLHMSYVDEISVKFRRHYFKIPGTSTVYKYACTNKIIHSFNPNLFVWVVKIVIVIIWIEGGGSRWRQRGWGIKCKEDLHFLDNISVEEALYMTRKCSYGPSNVYLKTRVIMSARHFDSWSQNPTHCCYYGVRSFFFYKLFSYRKITDAKIKS